MTIPHKEIPELCADLRKELTEFYESKVVSLEKDRQRYRKAAQDLVKKNRNLESLNDKLQAENNKLVNRVEYYRDLLLKERNKEKGDNS